MKTTFLTTAAVLSLAAGAVIAGEFSGSAGNQNLAALRLEGSWIVDPILSQRLDPARTTGVPKMLEFVRDDRMIRELQMAVPRFKNDHVYMGGTLTMDELKCSFLVTSEYGNAHLVLFKPTPNDPVGFVTTVNLCLACSRDPAFDLLFLGGDVPHDSAWAYERIPGK